MMTHQNRTEQDAWRRYSESHMGAHVESTEAYLMALRGYLHQWLTEIDAEIDARAAKQHERTLAATESYRVNADQEPADTERTSTVPPALAGNLEARATASKHFQDARRILRGIR